LVNLAIIVGTYLYPRVLVLGFILPYTTYVLVLGKEERKDGAVWNWFRRNFFILVAARQYLNLKLVWDMKLVESDKDPKSQFIFAAFPHGSNADYRIILDGVLADQMPNTFRRLRVLAATVLFRIPVVRELSLWTACVDASRTEATRLLERGRSLMVLPGGQAEQMRTVFGRERIYLNRRKGFIRLSLKHGVPIVPVYVFGCSDYYRTSSFAMDFRLALLKYTGMAIPIAFGWNGHLLCPRQVDTTVVLGAPLQFQFKGKMTEEEKLDSAHAQFCTAIQNLFDTHKESLGYGDRELEIM